MSWWTAIGIAAAGGSDRAAIAFEEVSGPAGVARTEKTFGAAWGDANGDGKPDLWVCHHDSKLPVLWINRGDGTFADATKEKFGELALVDFHASAWGDFDGDGDQDLSTLVGAEHGTGANAKKLFVNEGGKLVDRAAELGLDDPLSRGRTPLWLDWDRDGRLDVLYTSRTRDDGKAPSTLFLQKVVSEDGKAGEGAKPEGGAASGGASSGTSAGTSTTDGAESGTRWRSSTRFASALSFAEDAVMGNRAHAQLCDLEFDGEPELLLVFLDGTRLVRRDEAGATKVTRLAGGMDAAVVDLDGDGTCEVIPVGAMRQGGLLALRVTGESTTRRALLPASRSTITSIASGDFDNDGDLDLFLVSALTDDNDADLLLANDGGELVPVPKAGGAAGTTKGLGDSVAVADYDGDGFLDLFVTNGRGNDSEPGPCQLFHNKGRAGGNANHWLELDLEGTTSNRDGLGAIVTLEAGGRTQRRLVTGGMHAFTQDHARLHFGLGAAEIVTKLTIRWPSGLEQTLADVKADQLLRVREPPD